MIKGRVVLVPFPFDDLSSTKVRPAVCLTDAIGPHRHVIMAFISSQAPTDIVETDVVLDATQADFATTGLRVPSILRLHRPNHGHNVSSSTRAGGIVSSATKRGKHTTYEAVWTAVV